MAPEGPRSLTEGDDLNVLCGPAESGPVVRALSRDANRAGGSGALPWWKGTEGTVGAAGGEEPGAEEAGAWASAPVPKPAEPQWGRPAPAVNGKAPPWC